MKRYLLIALLLISNRSFSQYDHQNIFLLGRFYDSTVVAEPQYGIKYQACWGWADSIGREFGIIGTTAGTYFIDVTNPTNLVACDYVSHHQTDLIWHEYRTYGNLCYMISDNGNTGFQIADLSYLPDSVHLIYDSTGICNHAHTITIDGNKMYLGSVADGMGYSSMNVYSLVNPAAPQLLRRLSDDFPFISSVHDMFVMNDTIYASCGYDGLFIFRYDSVANHFINLSSLQDNSNIYNHSSVLSPDHKYLYMLEEVPGGQPIKVVDVNDVTDPTLDTTFYSHVGATPHNPSILGNKLIIAYYQDGVYIYDISNPTQPVLDGYFDTYPFNSPGSYPWPDYAGCWSTYSDLPSGILLAGDMQSGLFTLDASNILSVREINNGKTNIYPNPSQDKIYVNCHAGSLINIYDATGKNIYSVHTFDVKNQIDVSSLSSGMYYLNIIDGDKISSGKFVRQ